MVKSEDIKSYLKLKAIENDFKLIESDQLFTLEYKNLSKIEIYKEPNSKERWKTRVQNLEKPISEHLAGKPLLFSAHDSIEKSKSKKIIRLSFGLFLNSGRPNYKHYVFYKNGKKIVCPKLDYFEELVKKGKLIDSVKRNIVRSDLKAFHPYIESSLLEYQKAINSIELKEQKKWTTKYLEELYLLEIKIMSFFSV